MFPLLVLLFVLFSFPCSSSSVSWSLSSTAVYPLTFNPVDFDYSAVYNGYVVSETQVVEDQYFTSFSLFSDSGALRPSKIPQMAWTSEAFTSLVASSTGTLYHQSRQLGLMRLDVNSSAWSFVSPSSGSQTFTFALSNPTPNSESLFFLQDNLLTLVEDGQAKNKTLNMTGFEPFAYNCMSYWRGDLYLSILSNDDKESELLVRIDLQSFSLQLIPLAFPVMALRPAANDETLILSSWNGIYSMSPDGSVDRQPLFSSLGHPLDPTVFTLSPQGSIIGCLGNLAQIDSPTTFHFLINLPSQRSTSLAVDADNDIILLDAGQNRLFRISGNQATPIAQGLLGEPDSLIIKPDGNLTSLFYAEFELPDQFNVYQRNLQTEVDTLLMIIPSVDSADQRKQIFSVAADDYLYMMDAYLVSNYSLLTRQNLTLFTVDQARSINFNVDFIAIATGVTPGGETIVFVLGYMTLTYWTASSGLSVNLLDSAGWDDSSTFNLIVDSKRQKLYAVRGQTLEFYTWSLDHQQNLLVSPLIASFPIILSSFTTLDRLGNLIMLGSNNILKLSILSNEESPDSGPNNTAIFVGGIIGGLVVLGLLIVAIPRILKYYRASRGLGERTPLMDSLQNP